MAKLMTLADGLRMMATPTSCDTYSLPCGVVELSMPCPTVMSDDDWQEVKDWLAIIMRKGDRYRAKAKKPEPTLPAEQRSEGGG